MRVVITTIIFFVCLNVQAQFIVQTNTNPTQLAQRIVGQGVTISNVQFKGGSASAGFFKDMTGTLGIDSGIVLTTGVATKVAAPASSFMGDDNGAAGDADLNFLAGGTGYNACVLEFDFVPQGDSINIKYIFASEEYPNYTCTNYNDVFGFLATGPGVIGKKNIALVPGTTLPVKINSVNDGIPGPSGDISYCTYIVGPGSPFTQYYRNNSANQFVAFNGMTTVLTARLKVTPCQTYHIKLGVEDITDGTFDSGVFIEASSFKSNPVTIINEGGFLDAGNNPLVVEGCKNTTVKISLSEPATGSRTIPLSYAGTATFGVDYQPMPTSITFNTGDQHKILDVIPIVDNITEPTETIIITAGSTTCATNESKVTIYIKDSVSFHNPTKDTFVCSATPIVLTAPKNDTSNINKYVWNNSSTDTLRNLTVTSPGTYIVAHNFSYSCYNVDTFIVANGDPQISLGADTAICNNDSVTITAITAPPGGTFIWNNNIADTFQVVHTPGDYWVKYTLTNGCYLSDTVSVTTKPMPFPNLGADTAICSDASITLNANTYTGATYVWSTGATTNNITVSNAGTYSIISTLNGCEAKDTIEVTKSVLPTPSLGSDTTYCGSNGGIVLNATYPGATTYLWNTGATTATINITNSGTYIVTNTLDGCKAKDTITITIKPLPYANLITDTALCSYENFTLKSTTYPSATYTWNTGATTSSINVSSAGQYIVTNTLNGCSVKDTTIVTAKKPATAYAGPDLLMYTGGSVILTASQNVDNLSYQWTPPTYLSNPNSFTTQATPTGGISDMTYYLKVTSVDGCVAYDTVKINIQNVNFDVPNAFSPNGDGINDKWVVPLLVAFPTSRIQVFNRYGQIVFSGNGGSNFVHWDGTHNGKPVPVGVYYYVIDIGQGFPKKQGWVTIIR
ncbi:MAG: choice-of-anchor L domain-containing protein [Chitinophagaceae bacterium]|nr:choice-of-anchor L domain-containing protein [Chitinophagaceae bacterium]MCW5904014.1 choice-of-anchor L domain-containing protein [Chitinophagaceae bacterium]